MLPEVDDFEQTYVDLVAKRAYRHPHPGAPKGREGCMGGTWRHMKEAIGYGPGRLMWIDGNLCSHSVYIVDRHSVIASISSRPYNRLLHQRYFPPKNLNFGLIHLIAALKM